MPELPEAETLRRQLEAEVLGQPILRVQVFDPRLLQGGRLLRGEVQEVGRHGKALILGLDGHRVVLRLGMTGRLKIGEPDYPPRLTLHFPGKEVHLIDPRRFARVEPLGALPAGVDPLCPSAPEEVVPKARGSRKPLKAFLMDQQKVLGIGNIYACEVLYRAGLDPFIPAGDLPKGAWEALFAAAKEILGEAIALRGTTVSDWRDLYGRPGGYQGRLSVYGRDGEPCPRCGTPIKREVLQGRGTWYCPRCQKHGGGG